MKLIEVLYENYPKFCSQYGINTNSRELGSGSYGTTYDIGNGKVLKITSDELEGELSAYLKDMNLKNVWKVYFSGELATPFEFWGELYQYVIIGEKLEYLTAKERNIFGDLVNQFFDKGTNADIIKKFNTLNKAYKVYDAENENEDNGGRYRPISLLKTIQAQWEFKALKELKNAGISWHDNHAGNILKDAKGNYKFIDFGRGSSPGGNVEKVKGSIYPGDMGVMEYNQFLDKASEDELEEMDFAIEREDWDLFKHLIDKVLGIRLAKRER
ncbi:MAG: hypothetical protein WC783_01065 [Candidatus Paceibacterota bacterium]|jgi:hypothetical protein